MVTRKVMLDSKPKEENRSWLELHQPWRQKRRERLQRRRIARLTRASEWLRYHVYAACLQSVPVAGVMNAQISGLIHNRGGGFTNECIDVDLIEGNQRTKDPYFLPGVDMYDDDDITQILPDEASEVSGCTKYGEHCIGAKTCGDGCCALHSIWGVPVSSEHDVCWLCCTDARERLLASVSEDAGELLRGRDAGASRCLVAYF